MTIKLSLPKLPKKQSMRYFGSFSLFIFLAVLIHSCSSDESNTPNDPNIENNRPLGTSAADILGPNEYGSLTIELVYTNSFRPEPSSILGFKNFVLGLANKPEGLQFIERVIPNQPGAPFSIEEIRAIEEANRTVYTEGNNLGVYVFFSNGASENDTNNSVTLGTAYRNTSIVIYQKTLELITQTDPDVLPILEQTTLNHEMGHLMGLVNIQNDDIHQVHEDPNSEKHCLHEDCLMYYDATNVGRQMLNRWTQLRAVPQLDVQCLQDLQAKGAL
jgi:hypothetical protein